ncbi:beta-glucosidase [Pseudomonas sp. LRF_L74]|uniref:beta-glucosidase n=1 Tax=Pseudomonas sp. LRF_L74 TaxID=3369422 RepID=UPI003F6396E7
MRLTPGRRLIRTTAVLLLAVSVTSAFADAKPWLNRTLPAAERARLLLAAMTLEEKSALLYGYGSKVRGDERWQVYVKGNPRLGIPDMTQGDAPNGLMIGSRDVTQMPASVALAATFSRSLAHAYGEVIGRETHDLGYGVIHGPNVDVLRDPRHGRAHESYGEDPVLVSAMATAYVQGVQTQGVLADAKHFAVNTVEQDRLSVDARIDARTLNELYLAPFQDVVQDAQVAMVMCAYNKINGTHACDDRWLIQDLLRGKWGFTGIVRTDAGAVHGMDALRIGVDQEFREESQFGKRLIAAVHDGSFPEAAVDAAVLHILQTMMRYGIFDNLPQRTSTDLSAHAEQAQRVAEQSIVLLKNDAGLLPLDNGIGSLALIGAAAADVRTAGGPANPAPAGKDTVLKALRERLPHTRILFEPGIDDISMVSTAPGYPPLSSAMLQADASGTPGLTARYEQRQGTLLSRIDACLCFTPVRGFEDIALSSVASLQAPPENVRKVQWQGQLQVDSEGDYGFDLVGAGIGRLRIDGETQLMLDSQTDERVQRSLNLAVGAHRIELTFEPHQGKGHLKVGLLAPEHSLDPRMQAAVAAAKQADVAVVVVRDLASEANDRPGLSLPNDQERLIRAVAAANPRTVVVLASGSAVSLPWRDQVPALLEAWYGGTRGGAAIARVLLGEVDPGGRLPVSFPEREQDLATSAITRFPGVAGVTLYPEGLATGYRHHNRDGAPKAAYPFGYGLSYSTFAYSDLRLSRTRFEAGAPASDGTFKGLPALQVRLRVSNTGKRAGTVVPQVYLRYPLAAQVPTPLLKAFDSVYLQAGESREVVFELDQRAFSTFEGASGQWHVLPGRYLIGAGDSSVDLPLKANVEVL